MKILHIDTEKTWRGGEQQLLYLVKGLKERGHDSDVICQTESPLYRTLKDVGINAIPVKMRGGADMLAAFKVGQVLRKHRYDILHAHTSHAHSLSIPASLFGKARRMIVSRRVDFPINSPLKYNLLNAHYIAVSEAIRQVMVNGGVSQDRIDVVRSCIDLRRFDEAVIRDVRPDFKVASDVVLVGNIAHMADHKGQIYLVRAADIVRKSYPSVRFVIVGDGELKGSLEAEVKRIGLEETVIFTGFRDDVPNILASFDIFAFPSHLEGLGTSALDAMAMMKPVVATTAGGIPETVRNGVNGILVAPKDPAALSDAIITLIKNPEMRLRYGKAGRKIVEEGFTVERMVEGTLRVYERLLEGL